ncbi:hypothetical protein [Pseudomonas sp. EA_35y_Pfl2_R111]|uniref:hypothetical protein n=1 Tax=Pseudomonas sp. EA_35y_Pfl2_R111 TaxID=3088689 RepID=UPI0030D982DF
MDILNHRYYTTRLSERPKKAEAIAFIALLFAVSFKLIFPPDAFVELREYTPTYQARTTCGFESLTRHQARCVGNCQDTEQLQSAWEFSQLSLACEQANINTTDEINNVSLEDLVIQSIKKIPAF